MHDACKDLTQNRRHVIMVHAIIRIMQSSDLLNLNSNHECLILDKFYNF